MNKFHQFIDSIKYNEDLYVDCCSAIKFDLGDISDVHDLANKSKMIIPKLPFDKCLFQVSLTNKKAIFMVIAKKIDDYIAFLSFVLLDDKPELGFFCLKISMWLNQASDGKTAVSFHDEALNEVINVIGSDGKCTLKNLPDHQAIPCRLLINISASIVVFSCRNVKTIEHIPPCELNKARKKKGKVPYFSYHTLHIKSEESIGDTKGGTHSSPRLHFRRGHIRKLSTGNFVWVNHCLVGDKQKGFAGKDYKVDSAIRKSIMETSS